jgi:hypothetical protein
MATKSYSNLVNSSAAWNSAVRHFGITTVMNANVYGVFDGMSKTEYVKLTPIDATADYLKTQFETIVGPTATVIDFSLLKVNEIVALYLSTKPIAELKYLKTANVTQEGPTKTVTGGQNASPLIKYGKTSRLEIQDALGNAEAMEALMGTVTEYFRVNKADDTTREQGASDVIHAANTFAGPKTIIGETFVIDSKTAAQVPCYIIFYDFLPDSLFNLTQDAEGDATVFDMNGDLIQTNILVGDDETTGNDNGVVVGVFDSIIPQLDYAKNPQDIEWHTNP